MICLGGSLVPCQLLTLADRLLSPNLNGLACQVGSVVTLNKLHEAGLPVPGPRET